MQRFYTVLLIANKFGATASASVSATDALIFASQLGVPPHGCC
jgi:hypothetical protein